MTFIWIYSRIHQPFRHQRGGGGGVVYVVNLYFQGCLEFFCVEIFMRSFSFPSPLQIFCCTFFYCKFSRVCCNFSGECCNVCNFCNLFLSSSISSLLKPYFLMCLQISFQFNRQSQSPCFSFQL